MSLEQELIDIETDELLSNVGFQYVAQCVVDATPAQKSRLLRHIKAGKRGSIGSDIYELVRSRLRAAAAITVSAEISDGSVPIDTVRKLSARMEK